MGRLTRQELRWLLAQEARGAADALRQGVTRLTTQPPPPSLEAAPRRVDERLEINLNALDDAIGLLSELESAPGRPRRGRIDLAALLFELSPSARIAIEPGAGTEVFGEETELRRLLQMLSSQSSSPQAPGAEVFVRRDGEWVRVSANLGPELSASVDLERRWLSRMATRLGGRMELDGGTVSVLLPADASGGHTEVAALKQELEQAQQLGASYARELATIFEAAAPSAPRNDQDPHDVAVRRFELLVGVSGGLRAQLRPMAEHLQQDADLARTTLGEASPLAKQLARRATALSEVLGEINRVADCPVDEHPSKTNPAAVVRDVSNLAMRRAARHGVEIVVEIKDEAATSVRPAALGLLVRALLDHGIAATPRGGRVMLLVESDKSDVVLRILDGGPAIPAENSNGLLEGRLDPASLGRPAGIALLVAHAAAAHVGAGLTVGQGRSGATEIIVRCPIG